MNKSDFYDINSIPDIMWEYFIITALGKNSNTLYYHDDYATDYVGFSSYMGDATIFSMEDVNYILRKLTKDCNIMHIKKIYITPITFEEGKEIKI